MKTIVLKGLRYLILGILLLAVFTGAGTLTLHICGMLFKVEFANIWYSGFWVAVIALVLLFLGWFIRKRRISS